MDSTAPAQQLPYTPVYGNGPYWSQQTGEKFHTDNFGSSYIIQLFYNLLISIHAQSVIEFLAYFHLS